MIPENLEQNFRAALIRDVLTKTRVKKFIRKAHGYKLTYLFLFKETEYENKKTALSSHAHKKIEQIIFFKQHRSALDSDYGFISRA